MRIFAYVFVAAVTAVFIGCGDSDDDAPAPDNVTVTGKFIDSEVIGASYACSSGTSGKTDGDGTFTCNQNDTVTFSLGAYELGSCVAATKVTPRSLYPDNETAMLNISRLLQTVDVDGDPSESITVSNDFSALDGVTTRPTDAAFVADVETALGRTLVTEASALTHLNEMWANLGEHYRAEHADLAGKKITLSDGRVLSLYSDMLATVEGNDTTRGAWTLQNGVLVLNPVGVQPTTLLFDARPEAGAGVTSYGRTEGRNTVSAVEALGGDVNVTYALEYDALLGKEITTQSGKVFSYHSKMVVNDGSQYLAKYTWSVENGAVVHKEMCGDELYAVVYDAVPAAGTTLHYYDAQTLAEVNDTVTAVGDIADDPQMSYRVTVDELAGKAMESYLGDFSFFGDMTYQHHGQSTRRGSWAVNDGLVVLSDESTVYFFDASPAANNMLYGMDFCRSASFTTTIESVEDID